MRLLLALLSVRATQPWAARRRATPVTPRRATRDAAPAAPREAVGARAPPAPAPAKPPKIGECNEHLRRRAKARDAAGLRREWRALRRHHEPNDRSWGILLDGLARVGDADACLATLRAVPGGGNVVHHTIVVDALARAGRGDAALALYAAAAFKENARSRHARLRALTQAARDATLAGDVERARGHSRAAEAVAAECGDARGFQTAVACCREARDWEALLRVYDAHAASAHLDAPDGLARTAALQACRLARHGARRAHELWHAWRRDADGGITRDRPDAFAYSAYAAAFAPRGGLDLDDARRLLRDAERHGVLRPRGFNGTGRVDRRAEQNQMNLLASLLEGCAARGGVGDALVLVDDMEARGLAHDAGYAAAIAACARELDADTSGGLVQRAGEREVALGPRAWALAVKACGADAARAERRLRACRAARAASPHAYAFCLFACGSARDHRRARRVRRTAADDGLGAQPRVALAFVAALSRCGQPDAAHHLLACARRHAELDIPAGVWTNSMVAAARCQRGGDAAALYAEARRRDVDVGGRVVDALVELLADAGDWRRAWGVARDRRSRGERPPAQTAMARVVRAAEAAGCWREALALMDDMRRDDAVFYPNPLLDAAFKPGIMVWSALAGADLGPDDDDDLRMPPEKGDWGYKGPI